MLYSHGTTTRNRYDSCSNTHGYNGDYVPSHNWIADIYAFVEENPDVEGVSFALAIAAIIIGVIVSIVALALE